MSEAPSADANPAPAGDGVVEGRSFPLLVRAVSVGLALWIVVLALRPASLAAATALAPSTLAIMLAGVFVVFASLWGILRSRTSISATHIRQTWLWRKEVALVDIAQLKLIRAPGWDWLVTPRLVVRARGQGVVTFHAADPKVVRAFQILAYGNE